MSVIQQQLPFIGDLSREAYIYVVPSEGALLYKYAPFYNLKLDKPINGVDLTSLRLTTSEANLSIDKPLDINIEESYDGSANLIINDGVNPLKIINPRFYLTSSTSYDVGDRKGNLDSNIYTKDNFKVEANLIKSVQSVVKLDFTGLMEGGKMPVGNYTFYFRLADSDGNESDFISESGRVVCHIGSINQPKFIRGGQLNEDSGKSIKFVLKNIDLAYNFINVYYSRTSGDNEQETTSVYKILDKFKVKGIDTDITISGYEDIAQISLEDINVRYSEFKSSKTVENCQNITFSGGVTNDYSTFKVLEQLSLHITPEIVNQENIGSLNHQYEELFDRKNGFEYFNAMNIYHKLSYWDQEIYRLGIVYILNDYTLSPVFNIRGVKELTDNYKFILPSIKSTINYADDYIIEESNGLENAKGVFSIKTNNKVFESGDPIRPLGIKVNFNSNVVDGTVDAYGLKHYTRGFFIVRQKRIPTILAQAVGISTTKNGHLPILKTNGTYLTESFLKEDKGKPRLGASDIVVNSSLVKNNALLCPEANLRTEVYNNYFNSSEYVLMKSRYQPNNASQGFLRSQDHFYLDNMVTLNGVNKSKIKSSLLLIEPGIELIRNNTNKFASKAGDAIITYQNVDVKWGDYADPQNDILKKENIAEYNRSATKVRGIFNTYIGSDYNYIENATYYNIHQKNYDFESDWKDYFKLRYNDSSPFFPISDRLTYDKIDLSPATSLGINKVVKPMYRGDCYISTYTHRMNWNFIDPELPTNKRIVDRYTWHKNYRVANKVTTTVSNEGALDETLQYTKLLPLFTYRTIHIPNYKDDTDDGVANGLIDSEAKGFKKYSDRNGMFGFDKLNRPDVNAVGLGQWVTYKICSNVNLAMRDIDLSNPSEEAVHGMKRSFYPLQSMEKQLALPESRVLNKGISKTTGNKYYYEIPDVPFIKTNFNTRIHYSNILQQSSFVNGNRTFLAKNYQDYTSEYGSIVELVEWYGTLVTIMEHGVLLIPVNERAMMKNESGENVYINTDTVLPKNPKVLSNSFGSLWAGSIKATSKYIYGIDTVAKKIWRTDGKTFEIISDLKVQQFLNDKILLKETDTLETLGKNVIKTHYNAFKHDIMFTFKYEDAKWHLCWNELLEKWVTRYSWYPEFSENINNIFYTFANETIHKDSKSRLFKHGFAGTLAEEGTIKPTNWYDTQYPFEFEFVVTPNPGVQKIYNNFEIISNKVEPNSFIYEIVGDGLDWNELKKTILTINNQ